MSNETIERLKHSIEVQNKELEKLWSKYKEIWEMLSTTKGHTLVSDFNGSTLLRQYREKIDSLQNSIVSNKEVINQLIEIDMRESNSRWILVSDMLPPNERFVTIFFKYDHNGHQCPSMSAATYQNGKWISPFSNDVKNVTHWSPWPDFPKDCDAK